MLDEKILNILRQKSGLYVSGEELCKDAGISRTGVWKRIEKLREEGYEIEASPHLGYRLIRMPDTLIPSEIRWKLKTKVLGREVISYKKTDSTNNVAYALAEKGLREGSVITAEEQTSGKGRLGRTWVSPAKGGIYMSVILRPDIMPNEIPRITLMAAVAVAKAIRSITGLVADIKWPNDILINNKKVCGILTEMRAEQDTVDFIILGVGVNVNIPIGRLPKGASSLREELTGLGRPEGVSRIELTKKILENLEEIYMILKKKGFDPVVDAWKSLSSIIGARVKVALHNKTFEGQAYDIDKDGSLIVRREHGLLEKVSSGDVTIIK